MGMIPVRETTLKDIRNLCERLMEFAPVSGGDADWRLVGQLQGHAICIVIELDVDEELRQDDKPIRDILEAIREYEPGDMPRKVNA